MARNPHTYMKGLKFIRSPPFKGLKFSLLRDFDRLCRKMRCKYEFDDGENTPLHPFYVHSNYTPPMANNAIEKYIFNTKLELDNMLLRRTFSNLTKVEWDALNNLKKNVNITIKKVDKGSSIVVLNTIKDGLEHLNNIHYSKINTHNSGKILTETNKIVSNLNLTKQIDLMTYKYLNNKSKIDCGKLYFLMKLHKLPSEIITNLEHNHKRCDISIPGRPIIAQCRSPTSKICRLLDYFLLPLVQRQDTYIKDTNEFIKKIESTICPHNIVLCVYDLTSMYTNMHIQELIEAVERAFNNLLSSDYELPIIHKEEFLSILKLVLENNEFEFAGEYYIKKIGCPMGNKSSPEISDIRAYEVINSIYSKFSKRRNIILHCRFRVD